MPNWYDRYLQGFYQDTYDEMLGKQEQVFDYSTYEDALLVAREIMRRVRFNIELLIPRLNALGYQFGAGFWNQFDDVSAEEKASIEEDIPIFRTPTPETPERVRELEQLVGTLPLSLKCWYEEVGCINLIGLFSAKTDRAVRPNEGCILDPLVAYSIDMAIKMTSVHVENGTWSLDPSLSVSPDKWFKYGFSGSGAYSIKLPCKAFDGPLLGEQHNLTFINYLRLCFQWGGFPGVESDPSLLPREEIDFLTRDMLRF